MTLKDRYEGAMLGLAIGDALGVPVEFHERGGFEPVIDFQDSRLPAGHWSDDTAMALCLGESLIEKKEFDPTDQIEKYLQWLRYGYCSSTGIAVGVGLTILRSLSTYKKEDGPYVTNTPRRSDGNGSLMRLAPVPLYFHKNPVLAIDNAGLSSKTTHGSILCSDACRYFSGLIIGALNGLSKEELLSPLYCPVKDYFNSNKLSTQIENVALGSFKNKSEKEIRGSGYVVESLEAALWAFYNSESFEEGVLMAVNLGDDADTTGAIFGQLAGAYYGITRIPGRWVDSVAKREEIIALATKLMELSEAIY